MFIMFITPNMVHHGTIAFVWAKAQITLHTSTVTATWNFCVQLVVSKCSQAPYADEKLTAKNLALNQT